LQGDQPLHSGRLLLDQRSSRGGRSAGEGFVLPLEQSGALRGLRWGGGRACLRDGPGEGGGRALWGGEESNHLQLVQCGPVHHGASRVFGAGKLQQLQRLLLGPGCEY
ncbi:hypothetical protein OIY81_3682, partial [Cryptosporidium canis]